MWIKNDARFASPDRCTNGISGAALCCLIVRAMRIDGDNAIRCVDHRSIACHEAGYRTAVVVMCEVFLCCHIRDGVGRPDHGVVIVLSKYGTEGPFELLPLERNKHIVYAIGKNARDFSRGMNCLATLLSLK